MNRRPDLSPRRTPRQERSRATVERILDAAGRILAASGYDGASTHRIAEAAGLSHGSLYQYFPNKDAIVVAVLDRFAARLAERLDAAIETAMTTTNWHDANRSLLDAHLRLLEENAPLVRVLAAQFPRLGPITELVALEHRISDLIRLYLRLNRPAFRPDLDVDTATWILATTIATLTTRYIVDRPPIPRDQLLTDLQALVSHYLNPPPPAISREPL